MAESTCEVVVMGPRRHGGHGVAAPRDGGMEQA